MLYLAKVLKPDRSGNAGLQLLAQKKAEHFWTVIPPNEKELVAGAGEIQDYSDGVLLIVKLSNDRQVKSVQEATRWILDTINQYLSQGITPEQMQEEVERLEQWRQSLTLQSQDLGRQKIELETRRDQIQELEKKLEQERKQIEIMMERLKADHDLPANDASTPQPSSASSSKGR
ncbi:MAG: hypothetical protein VKK04_18070 [Synechococcales bacterium]|nr:hypothetical protein [Synechococcales bacterium]